MTNSDVDRALSSLHSSNLYYNGSTQYTASFYVRKHDSDVKLAIYVDPHSDFPVGPHGEFKAYCGWINNESWEYEESESNRGQNDAIAYAVVIACDRFDSVVPLKVYILKAGHEMTRLIEKMILGFIDLAKD
jgi:hypothetical protein